MQDVSLSIDPVELVICGRYEKRSDGHYTPDQETESIIERMETRLRQRELYPYASINFCNCGNAFEYGPSITILPEKVRYLDVDDNTIETVLDRHVEEQAPQGVSG
ncbi:MAG: hypothetical protein ABEK50_13225 [bacterium]